MFLEICNYTGLAYLQNDKAKLSKSIEEYVEYLLNINCNSEVEHDVATVERLEKAVEENIESLKVSFKDTVEEVATYKTEDVPVKQTSNLGLIQLIKDVTDNELTEKEIVDSLKEELAEI